MATNVGMLHAGHNTSRGYCYNPRARKKKPPVMPAAEVKCINVVGVARVRSESPRRLKRTKGRAIGRQQFLGQTGAWRGGARGRGQASDFYSGARLWTRTGHKRVFPRQLPFRSFSLAAC
jgi:hypothetical protein